MKRPIHLLEFGLRWPPETFIRAKLERLAARGLTVTVACAEADPRPGANVDGIRVEPVIPAGRTSPASLASALLRLAVTRPRRLPAVVRAAHARAGDGREVPPREALGRLRTYARLASLEPDVVHFEWSTAAVHFHSVVDALGCPSVVSVRGGDLDVIPSTAAEAAGLRSAFQRAAAVHCVSAAAGSAAAAHGLRAKRRVIRPAVDLSLFPPRPAPRRPDGAFHIVGVGWLHWWKGWEYALQAVARLVAEGVPVAFDVVGPQPAPDMGAPSDLDRIRNAIDDLGLAPHVTVHGPLPHERVRALLGQADVLLHASVTEGLPNVVLEAMASGLPVVATDVGGTGEVVADGVEGYLVPPRDPRAAADALVELWRDPERRRAMGEAGRARVEQGHDLDQQADRWVELYEQVVVRPPPARGPRIVEVGVAWPPEPFLRRKLQGLAERGAEVTVASIVPPRRRQATLDGIVLQPLPHWAEPRYRLLLGVARDAGALLVRDRERLRAILRKWDARPPIRLARLHLRLARLRADVAHFEWASFASTCSPLFRVWDFPVVVSCHGSEVLAHRAAEPVDLAGLFRRVDAVHCVSRAVQRAAVEHGLDGTRVEVVPSAVDPDVFRPPRRERPPTGELLVVTVGGLRWVKGYEYALAAIGRLVEAGVPVRYEIAGSEPPDTGGHGELDRILEAIRDLGLDDRVRLLGHLSEPEIVSLLQRADVHLQASLSEGMPTAILEAMACGLPVVATDVGGTREVLTDGDEGLLVAPRDPDALAAALHLLWSEPERRRSLGRAGRARVETELTLERQLDRFESLYRELAAS